MFDYNWQEFWTEAQITKGLKGFKFRGPGWYINETDTVLIESHSRSSKVGATDEPRYKVTVLNSSNGREIFIDQIASLLKLPTFQD